MNLSHRTRLFVLMIAVTVRGLAPVNAQMVRQDAKLKLPRSLPTVAAYTTEDAFGKGMRFQEPLAIVTPPGETERFFVIEKHGTVQLVTRHGGTYDKKLFFDLNAMLKAKNEGELMTDSEMGLVGMAFHPEYAKNGYFYLAYDFGVQENGQTVMFDRVARFSVSKSDPSLADPNSELPMITQLDLATNHNAGDLHFGADGYLYYAMGDEGNQYDHYDNARHINKDFFSAIFRLDVDRKPGNLEPNPHKQASTTYPSAVNAGSYKVPADNPFVNATMHNGLPVNKATLRTEFWVCGLRNPWRFSFDPKTNDMYIGDVGQDRWEEVDIGKAGYNYGWSYYEGTHDGPRLKELPANGDVLTPPIYEYPHGEGSVFNGIAVIGGVVYRGSRLPELNGTYIFGDYGTRRVWGLVQVGTKWVPSLLDTFGGMTSFNVDPANGDILITDLGGNVGRLVRAEKPAEPPPAVLSQTGVFSNTATLAAVLGVQAYEPIQPGWNGNVTTQHWFGIPNGSKIIFHTTGDWEFPTGMVWAQQIDAGGRKLETRLLVKTEDSVYGLTYKWRADQTDADLVPEGGLTDAAPASSTGPGWHYPGRAECAMCHAATVGYAPGFNTWQLNHPMVGNPQVTEVKALLDSGYMEDRNRDQVKAWPTYAALSDNSQPVEARVKSYLAVNCAACHQPGGLGLGVWDARPNTPLRDARIVGAQLVSNFGDAANRVIAPGDVQHSMMLRRLKGDGVPKMPLIGVPYVDGNAVALITQWIQGLGK